MQVTGPSQSGKSEWVAQLLLFQHWLLESPVKRVYWHSPHGHIPNSLSQLDEESGIVIENSQNLPWLEEEEQQEQTGEHTLIVIDDFAQETKNSKELTSLFTRQSHHSNTSIIQLSQNLFGPALMRALEA